MDANTMKAATYDRYGTTDVVRIEDVDIPHPGDGEIVVRIRAASVNRADLDALGPRPGFARLFMGLRAPRDRRLGVDVAGVVDAADPAMTRFRSEEAVFGDLFAAGKAGAFAEWVAAKEKAFQPIPAGMSFEDAATLPHSAVLALQSLRLRNGRTIKPGDRVLVAGASGSVGPFAVQIAKARGAEVTGVCRTEKVDFVRSLGADHVIDYTKVDYTWTGERYDWIVDTDSHHSPFAVRRALRASGVYVTLGGTSWPIFAGILVAPLLGRLSGHSMGLMLWWKPMNPDDVQTIKELIAAGKVKPIIDRRFPLAEVVGALRYVDEGSAKGKVVITVSEGDTGNPS